MIPNPSLLETFAATVFVGLCNLTWRTTLLVAVAAACTVWLPARNRTLRYMLWLSVLVAFAWVMLVPGFGSRLTAWAASPSFSEWLKVDLVAVNTPLTRAPAAEPGLRHQLGSALTGRWQWVPLAVAGFWLTGAIVMAGRFVASRAGLFLLRENAHPVHRGVLLDMFRDLSAQIGTRRETVVLASGEVKAPVVLGIFRPAVILPESIAEQYPVDMLEPILIHELVHIRRRDHVVNGLQRLLAIGLFFHPLYWVVNHILASERERSCDDYVVRLTGAPRRYALCLAELAEYIGSGRSKLPERSTRMPDRRSMTEQRVESLASRKTVPPRPSAALIVTLIVVATVVTVPVSASRIACDWRTENPDQVVYRTTPPTAHGVGSVFGPQDTRSGRVSFRIGNVGQWDIRPDTVPAVNGIKHVKTGEGHSVENTE